MINLIKAVLAVMEEVKSVEKSLNVGTGQSSYKGVADKDVKQTIGQAMQKHGLIILTTGIMPESTLSEWDQEEIWNGKTQTKHKTLVFTKVKTKYTLMHSSGETIDLVGYGHGVDSQDKSAGKATTYALKYALLNTFLVPTGDIDDTDSTHSDSLPQKPSTATKNVSKEGMCPMHGVEFKQGQFGPYHSKKEGDNWLNCKGTGYYQSKNSAKPAIPLDETPIQKEVEPPDDYESNLSKSVSEDIPF